MENEEIIIVSAFPNNVEKSIALLNTLSQLKKTDKEILLITHYPVSTDALKLVNYYIYDCRDDLITEEDYAIYNGGWHKFWFTSENVEYFSNLHCGGQHSYSIYQEIQLALSFCRQINKSFIYYLQYDIQLSDTDLSQFAKIKQFLNTNSYEGYFERIPAWGNMMSACIFAGDLNFFRNVLPPFSNKKEYLNYFQNDFVFEWGLTKLLFNNESVYWQDTEPQKIHLLPNTATNIFDFKINKEKNYGSHVNVVADIKNEVYLIIFNKLLPASYMIYHNNGETIKQHNIHLKEESLYYLHLPKVIAQNQITVLHENKVCFNQSIDSNATENIKRNGGIKLNENHSN